MTAALWLQDLFAYSLQLALVVAAGFLLASLFSLRSPRVKLTFAQGLLGLALLLPWLQPWKVIPEEPARVMVETRTLEPAAAAAFDVTGAVAALLVGGALFRLALLGRRLRRLRRYRRLSRRLDDSAAVADAWQRVGVRAPVYASAEIGVPAAFGALRPVVLVPEHFTDLDAAAQRAVLCHELLHVRRQDWLQMIAEELAGAVLWFHPALWFVIARIRVAREQVVDEAAVRLTRERRAYLETLVGMARVAAARTVAPAALFLTESHLKGRVDVLLTEVSMSKKRMVAGLAATVAGVAVVGVVGARAFPLEAPARTVAGPAVADEGAAAAGKTAAKQAPERKVVSKVNPSYPAEAKEKGIEGIVQLDVLITAAGAVRDVKVTKGPSELQESALNAVKQWRYEAGPHDTRATLTINYRLDKDEKPRP
jgi:TonB family protein